MREISKGSEQLPSSNVEYLNSEIVRLENVSILYSQFLEELHHGPVPPETAENIKELSSSISFKELYHGLPGRINVVTERFEMHLGMLKEIIL